MVSVLNFKPTNNCDTGVSIDAGTNQVKINVGANGELRIAIDNGDIASGQSHHADEPRNEASGNPILNLLNKLIDLIAGEKDGTRHNDEGCGNGGGNDDVNITINNGGAQTDDSAPATDSGATQPPGSNTAEGKAREAALGLLNSTSFAEAFPDGVITRDRLKEISANKDGKFDPQAVDAANDLLANKLAFDVLDNADRGGVKDGVADKRDLEVAAGMHPTRQAAMAILSDQHLQEKHGGLFTIETMHEILKDPEASKESKAAAQFFIDNPLQFNDVEMADTGNQQDDGLAGASAFEAYIAQGDKGITEDQHGKGRQDNVWGAAAAA